MDPLKGNIFKVFVAYVLPTIIGMLALSSSGVIDGIFVGNYVGSDALAAVNISIPLITIVIGLALMFGIGGSVTIGKLLGEGKDEEASSIFTALLLTVLVVSAIIGVLGFIFIDPLVLMLGANEELLPLVREYLGVIILFVPVFMIAVVMVYAIRVDNRPILASTAYVFGAAINIFFDWYFLTQLELGLAGAAAATVIGNVAIILVMTPYFFNKSRRLRFTLKTGAMRHVGKAAFNGSSDFANEASAGIAALIFNWVMMNRFGIDGVAAFAVVNYILLTGLIISFAVSDALQPIISQCYGAKDHQRISAFLKIGFVSVFLVGVGIIALLLTLPQQMVGIFLEGDSSATAEIAGDFITYFWPAFLFSGLTILLAGYLTAMHRPMMSAVIAISRSMVLPVIFLLALPPIYGNPGIYSAIPVAEFIGLIIGVLIFRQLTPKRIVEEKKDVALELTSA